MNKKLCKQSGTTSFQHFFSFNLQKIHLFQKTWKCRIDLKAILNKTVFTITWFFIFLCVGYAMLPFPNTCWNWKRKKANKCQWLCGFFIFIRLFSSSVCLSCLLLCSNSDHILDKTSVYVFRYKKLDSMISFLCLFLFKAFTSNIKCKTLNSYNL